MLFACLKMLFSDITGIELTFSHNDSNSLSVDFITVKSCSLDEPLNAQGTAGRDAFKNVNLSSCKMLVVEEG